MYWVSGRRQSTHSRKKGLWSVGRAWVKMVPPAGRRRGGGGTALTTLKSARPHLCLADLNVQATDKINFNSGAIGWRGSPPAAAEVGWGVGLCPGETSRANPDEAHGGVRLGRLS